MRKFLEFGRRLKLLGLILAVWSLAACGVAVDEPAGAPASEPSVGTTTQALHEGTVVKVFFDLYWYDLGLLDFDDDFWGRVDFDGGQFDPPNFAQGDLGPDPDGLALGIESDLMLQHTYPPGVTSAAIDIGLVEDDGQTSDDDIFDIDPGNDGDIDITVDFATGEFTGEASSDGCIGCPTATAGNPGDGSNGIVFRVIVENHCQEDELELPGNGIDDDCDGQVDEPACCCGDGETCDSELPDPVCSSDRDGDGLLDIWETRGFDADCSDGDNTIDVDLPSWGVSPDHKDILLEYDFVGVGSVPTQAMVRAAKLAFRNAPIYAGGVDNPDGKPGINLWIDTGPLADFAGIEPGPNGGSCIDGVDNDGDGQTDELDQDCLMNYGVEGVGPCDNGIDDDHDGLPDAVDPDCALSKNFEGEGSCGDGIDNDNDGERDAFSSGGIPADKTCAQPTAMEGAGTCFDGIDNDGDGLLDGNQDPDCLVGDNLVDAPGVTLGGGQGVSMAHVDRGSRIVGDNLSLDGPGIAFRPVKSIYFSPYRELFFHYLLVGPDRDLTVGENGLAATEGATGGDRSCEDFTDNDGDGLADLFDSDCQQCSNGVDDDQDSQTDYNDTDCIFFGNRTLNGLGEGHGNDLIALTSDALLRGAPTQAGVVINRRMRGTDPVTLVHELGHNLGLGHGGHENRNCKPNYVSVMNYLNTAGIQQLGSQEQDVNRSGIARDAATIDFWPPRSTLGRPDFVSTLNETALIETQPLIEGDPDNQFVFYHPDLAGSATAGHHTVPVRGEDLGANPACMLAADGVPDGIDWDQDCTIDTTAVSVDIGGHPALAAYCEQELSPVPMEARNDWRALDLKFRDDPAGAPGTGMPHSSIIKAMRDDLHATDLELTTDGQMRPDGRFEMEIQVENLGPRASGHTYLSIPLPPGASLFQTSAAECQEFVDGANRMVICSLRRAEVGQVFGLTLVFNVTSAATCQFGATVQNLLDETGRSETSTVTDCGVDVSVTLTAAPNPALAGSPLTYHVTISNAGPSRAENVTASIVLAAGTSFQGATASCVQGPTNTLTCSLGGLDKGQSTSFDITTLIAPNVVSVNGGPATLTTAAVVTSSSQPELNAANNVASVATQAVASADLELVSIAALSPPAQLVVGSPVNVVVREVVNNHGLASPINGQVLQSATATTGSSATPVAATVLAPALVRETPRTFDSTFTLRCDRPGTHTFTLRGEVRPASSLDSDPNAANNARTTTVTVNCTPCLHATESLVLKNDTLVTSSEVLGGTAFELGSQQATVTGNVFVRGNAILRSTARINGNLTLFGIISPQSQQPYTVTGTTLQNTAVSIAPIPPKTVSIGTLDLSVPVNGVQTWAPGNYDEALVSPNGEARLTAGIYNFRRLTLSPDTDLVLNVTGGDILINARDFADFGDRTRFLKTGSGKVFVYTNSTGVVRVGVDVDYRGSLRAPQATLNVYSDTTFEGCVAARRITFEPQVSLLQQAGAGAP